MYETSSDVIDALRVKLRAHTDSEIARQLGVTTGAVAHWRVGRSVMSTEVTVRAAELLEVPPDLMLLKRYAELEKSEVARRVILRMASELQRAAKKAGKAVAVAALAVAGAATLPPPSAQASTPELNRDIHYAHSHFSRECADAPSCASLAECGFRKRSPARSPLIPDA